MKTYVVSGSASGIGAALTARLRADGHTVIGVDLHDAEVIGDLATASGRDGGRRRRSASSPTGWTASSRAPAWPA